MLLKISQFNTTQYTLPKSNGGGSIYNLYLKGHYVVLEKNI